MKWVIFGGVFLIYGAWVATGPLETLEMQYGDSGLTWGILVFGLMIPYGVYFIFNLGKSGQKRKPEDRVEKENKD